MRVGDHVRTSLGPGGLRGAPLKAQRLGAVTRWPREIECTMCCPS